MSSLLKSNSVPSVNWQLSLPHCYHCVAVSTISSKIFTIMRTFCILRLETGFASFCNNLSSWLGKNIDNEKSLRVSSLPSGGSNQMLQHHSSAAPSDCSKNMSLKFIKICPQKFEFYPVWSYFHRCLLFLHIIIRDKNARLGVSSWYTNAWRVLDLSSSSDKNQMCTAAS